MALCVTVLALPEKVERAGLTNMWQNEKGGPATLENIVLRDGLFPKEEPLPRGSVIQLGKS